MMTPGNQFYSKVEFAQNCLLCLYQNNSQVSVYRTIGPLVLHFKIINIISLSNDLINDVNN